MYLNFYGFRAEPFHITPDPAFLYLSHSHKEALGAIVYGISRRKGFVAISGEVGAGKTTILRAYLEGTDISRGQQNLKVIFIFNANLSFDGLLQTMCRELDRVPPAGQTYEVVNFLHRLLIEEYGKGHTIVLVVDEAQNMPLETLENLRMLSNLETSREKLLQIVLVGQPEFDALLNRPQLRQLNQRIAIRTRIQPLSRKESVEYLYHRLAKVTDAPQAAFTPSAVRLIARHGKGAPRVLNILSDNALIAGFGYQIKPVTSGIVRETIADYRGRRPSGLLRWMIVPVALALSFTGLLLTPAGKNLLTGVEPLARSLRVRMLTVGQQPEAGNVPASRTAAAAPSTAENPESPVRYTVPEARPTQPDENSPLAPATETIVLEAPFQPVSRADETVSGPAAVDTKPLKLPQVPSISMQPIRYVVRKGETLTHISQTIYGASDSGTLEWILSRNPQIQDRNRLMVGDSLLLPDRLTHNP